MFDGIIGFLKHRRARRMLERRGLVGGRRRHHEETDPASSADRSVVLGIFMLILIWGICSLLLTLSSSNQQTMEKLVLGQRAPQTINAEFDFTYEDRNATEQARQEASRNEPRFYHISEVENTRIQRIFKEFFDAVTFRVNPDAPDIRTPEDGQPAANLAAGLDPAALKVLYQCIHNPAAYRYFENELNALLVGGFLGATTKAALPVGQKIRVIDPQQRERLARTVGELSSEWDGATRLADAVLKFFPPDQERKRLQDSFSTAFRVLLGVSGNLTFDPRRTESGRVAAAAKVEPVTAEIQKHHPIIRKGELVDDAALERLTLYERSCAERADERGDWHRPMRNMFWSLTLVVLAGFYLYHIHPEVVGSNRRISIVGSVVIIALICNYIGIEVFKMLSSESRTLQPALVIDAVPLALVAVLMAAFLGFRVAMCTGFFVASITALMLDLSFEFALKGIVICSLTALAVRSATNYRSFFLRTIFSVFPLVWLLNANIFGAARNWQEVSRLALQSGSLAVGNALITAILALLLIFAYELLFNVTTNMSLMVLCDYNHPLLERMKREAPGTFFHSLMVATLAEDAAREIGANYLRAKAGALFHDIGKLSKPQYFTENNQDMGNQHTELTPQMSSMIIRDHVKEGLELARQYKLSRIVREAIEQHHGNDLVHYFYRRAMDNSRRTGDAVAESQFRYQGRPPHSKEAAIISLADACEAASRSLDKPSAARIEALVDEIFQKRFRDGQLIHADMTLEELEKVRESFINTLLSMKHGRVAYQKEKDQDEDDLFMAAGHGNGGGGKH